jgi:phosphatidylcholine synthase
MLSMWPAALVHGFTALGAVCGLLATLAVIEARWEAVFAWLGLALLIDGADGTLARRARVQTRLPRFSGDRLDLVIDYITYVFVPAVALLQAGHLRGMVGLLLAALILLSSLFHFSDTHSKTDDYCFVGFPAIWNIVAFYIFALATPPWFTAIVVFVLAALTFIPIPFPHPLRTPMWRAITVALTGAAAIASGLTLWNGFPAPLPARIVLILAAVYSLALVLVRSRIKVPGRG